MCRSNIPCCCLGYRTLVCRLVQEDKRDRRRQKDQDVFFQQAMFESTIATLHPRVLAMIPFQIVAWGEAGKLSAVSRVTRVRERDFGEWQLPVPAIRKKIMAAEARPGLSAKYRDKTCSGNRAMPNRFRTPE